jgi:hypothetical protein
VSNSGPLIFSQSVECLTKGGTEFTLTAALTVSQTHSLDGSNFHSSHGRGDTGFQYFQRRGDFCTQATRIVHYISGGLHFWPIKANWVVSSTKLKSTIYHKQITWQKKTQFWGIFYLCFVATSKAKENSRNLDINCKFSQEFSFRK